LRGARERRITISGTAIFSARHIEQLNDGSLHDLVFQRRDPKCRSGHRAWESSAVVTAAHDSPRMDAPVIHEFLVKVFCVRIPTRAVDSGRRFAFV
jgi:hypothetical protein